MSVLSKIETLIHDRRKRHFESLPGVAGKFYRDGGNDLPIRDLPLTSDLLAIDAGGYLGDWSREIAARYGCRIKIFEPIPSQADAIRKLFALNDRVDVVAAALAGADGEIEFAIDANSSSAFANRGTMRKVKVPMADVASVLRPLDRGGVGCLKLNIEGAEYDLLERLLSTHLIDRAASIVVQFHTFVPHHAARRDAIRSALAQTHVERFCYDFIWERWELTPASSK